MEVRNVNEIQIKILEHIIFFQTAAKGPTEETLWKCRQRYIFYCKKCSFYKNCWTNILFSIIFILLSFWILRLGDID